MQHRLSCPASETLAIQPVNIQNHVNDGIVLTGLEGYANYRICVEAVSDGVSSPETCNTFATEANQGIVIKFSKINLPLHFNLKFYKLLRVSEANEVPISSHIWVALSTLNRL